MKNLIVGIAGAMLATAGLAAEPPSSDPSQPTQPSDTSGKVNDTGKFDDSAKSGDTSKYNDTKKLGSTPSKFGSAEASAKDLAAIKEVATNIAKAFNDGDAKAAAQYFTADARVYNPKGKQASGRDDIQRLINEDLNGLMKDTNTTFTNIEVKMVRPDLAFVDMDQDLALSKNSDSNVEKALPRIHVSSLAVKQNGKWMVLEARAAALLEEQPTTSS